ncbi:MAG: hypothetical protein ACI8X5_001889, partial [Planctomycetota bacterium]
AKPNCADSCAVLFCPQTATGCATPYCATPYCDSVLREPVTLEPNRVEFPEGQIERLACELRTVRIVENDFSHVSR